MFNQKKEQKKMKKFWNLMLAALVIFGAVACTEKEVAPEQNAGMSFTASIDLDETRTDVVFNEEENVWETVWTGNETLFVRAGYVSYPFKNSVVNKNVFTCATAPESIKGSNVTITLGHDDDGTELNSLAGKAGGSMKYQGVFSDNITISVNSAFLRFKSASDVALQASVPIFVVNGVAKNEIQLTAGDDVWVAVKQMYGVTLSAIIDGETIKSKEDLDFVAKKIYNLGTLGKKSEYGVVGSFQTPTTWDVAAPVAMYEISGGWAVAKNVELYKSDEFKIVTGNSWDNPNYGLKDAAGVVAENTEVALTKGGQNIKVAKNGKFDIYFKADGTAFKYECVEEYTDLKVNITINNKANWSPLTMTLKDGDNVIANKATVTGNKFPVSGEYIGKTLSCQFFSGSKESEVMNVSITKTGAAVTLEETVIKLTVKLVKPNSQQWWGNTMKIHAWNTGTSFDTTWPGNTMTSEGNYTWSIIVPSELVGKKINFLVHNGNGWQSANSTVTISAEGNTVDDNYLNIN